MDKYIDKAFGYIDAIAEKLGVASEHVYEVLVTQAILTGWMQIVVGIILVAFMIISTFLAYKINFSKDYKKIKVQTNYGQLTELEPDNVWAKIYEALSDTSFGSVVFIAYIMILIVGVVSVIGLVDGIMNVLNPEYYAIKELLKVLGGM